MSAADRALRRTVIAVCLLNLAYFVVEFAAALHIGSVALFADSVDFLEDASVNFLVALALGWSLAARARVGTFLAIVLLVPALAFLWAIVGKLTQPTVPEAETLSLVGAGALAVNVFCAFLLARHRRDGGSLTRAAFLSARNDAIANVAIILAGIATLLHPSVWPDIVVGTAIAAMNIDAAREVWRAARSESQAAVDDHD
jgi:Co/Zn/Cd efflux system component